MFPDALQCYNSLTSLRYAMLHRNRMHWLHANSYHCDDHWFLLIPSTKFQHCRSDWCAKSSHDDTVHVISAAVDSQQPMHPIRHLTGCFPRWSWATIDLTCRNHMFAIPIVTSCICDYSQHFAQFIVLAAWFASSSTRRNSDCFTGSIWEYVCKIAHASVSFSTLHSPNPNCDST